MTDEKGANWAIVIFKAVFLFLHLCHVVEYQAIDICSLKYPAFNPLKFHS